MSSTIKTAFDAIKADSNMKATTKEVLYKELEHTAPHRTSHLTRRVLRHLAIAMILFALVFSGGMKLYQTTAEAAYLKLEGPVQIGLSLGQDNTILSATGLNQNGKKVLAKLQINGTDYEEALEIIMETDIYRQCQGERASIKVTCKNKEQKTVLQQNADKTCHSYAQKYRRQQGNKTSQNGHNQDEEKGFRQRKHEHNKD